MNSLEAATIAVVDWSLQFNKSSVKMKYAHKFY